MSKLRSKDQVDSSGNANGTVTELFADGEKEDGYPGKPVQAPAEGRDETIVWDEV